MANSIASLLVQIGADTSGLIKGAAQGSKSLDDLGDKAKSLGKTMAALGAAAAAAGAAVVAGLVKSGLEAIDTQAKLARALDTSIDGLRSLQIAAADAGVGHEELAGSMRMLNQRLGDAEKGSGAAHDALERLGLSARDLSGMDADSRVAAIADAVQGLGLSSTSTADILRDLGIRGENFISIMRGGGDAIRAARQEVEDYGLSLSKVDATKVEQANDAMERIGRIFQGIRDKITVAIAPVLGELADRFSAVAKENQGFGDQAVAVAESVALGFAKVLDVFHGLHVALKGLQLIGEGFGAAFYSALEVVMNLVIGVNDAVAGSINNTIGFINALGGSVAKIPLMGESEWAQDFRAFADGSRDRVARVREELLNLAMQEMPSDKVEAFFAAVQERANAAAEAAAAADPSGGNASTPEFDPTTSQENFEKEMELLREQYEMRLALETELKAVNDAAMEALEKKHMDEIGNIRYRALTDVEKFTADSFKNQVKTVSGHLADITAGVSRENKAMFEINKVAGIANAIVAAYEGIALTMSKYPYPINIGLAAAHAAAAFAQVNAIKSATFSKGGGAAPSLAGGTPATPVTPVSGGTPTSGERSVLTVEGIDATSLFSGRVVRELAERLNEHARDGGTVQFA